MTQLGECMNTLHQLLPVKTLKILIPSVDQVIKDSDLSLLLCSPKDVNKILNQLKPRKSPGEDDIYPMILTKCAGTLVLSLSDVFNASIASGMLPRGWKLADITPLHKKGVKNVRKNYRPVSLTSMVCKVCEMIVRHRLVHFWTTNQIFIPEQFGFLKG